MLTTLTTPGAALVMALLVGTGAANAQTSQTPVASRPDDSRGERGNRFGLSAPLPRTPGGIRLATYNLLNFFDQVDDPALEGEFDDLKMATSPERCQKLAEAILAIDADIVALQEVESLEALRWFRDTYLAEAGYRYLASEDVGYYRGIECSVMSRFPILETRIWPELSLDDVDRSGPGFSSVPRDHRKGLKFQRSPLMVTVKVDDDYELTVFSIHHKSGRDYNFQREAEALRLVELVNAIEAQDPDRNIVLMGDFNAAPWYKSFRIYLQHGFVDTLAHRVIPPRNESQNEARLYKTHESDRVLDYVLLNSAAFRELVIGSPHVFGTLTPPESYDYRTDPPPTGYASDHYPVIIDLIPEDRP